MLVDDVACEVGMDCWVEAEVLSFVDGELTLLADSWERENVGLSGDFVYPKITVKATSVLSSYEVQ